MGERLDPVAIEARLERVDRSVAALEQTPGRTAELALGCVEALVEVYGEALARLCERLAPDPATRASLVEDELLANLLLLHRLHPDSAEVRLQRAVAAAQANGSDVHVLEVRDETVHIGVSSHGCGGGCGPGSPERVRDEILALVPELAAVEVRQEQAPALIPVATLTRRSPAALGGER